MKLTKAQKILLQDIYVDTPIERGKGLWFEPIATDHPRTLQSLVDKEILEESIDGLFRLTSYGIEKAENP